LWVIIKKCLKDKGINELYSLCDSSKEVKFNKFWGFKDTGLIAHTDDGTKIILKLEL
jgi:hypothetical protein